MLDVAACRIDRRSWVWYIRRRDRRRLAVFACSIFGSGRMREKKQGLPAKGHR